MATVPNQAALDVNVGQLLQYVPGIAPARIRLVLKPGGATETDVVRLWEEQKILCELVDGMLVEKLMGFLESAIAAAISMYLRQFVKQHDLGVVTGEAGMLRIAAGQVLMPDVSYVSWDQLPGRRLPVTPIVGAHPDLAVEVLSPSNTDTEMTRKIGEYFASGTRLVWVVDPPARTVAVYTTPDKPAYVLRADETLTGGELLPGFELPVARIFEEL